MKNSKKINPVILAIFALVFCAALIQYISISYELSKTVGITNKTQIMDENIAEDSKDMVSEMKQAIEDNIPTVQMEFEDDGLPHDKLFITPERQKYQSGDLRLIIPKLEVDIPILDGTEQETLRKGEGLYEYAQLPGEGNRNVSIAGHRNSVYNGKILDNMPFYYIDTLTDDDCLYLVDDEFIYRYIWDKTTVVEETDWGPIYSQGFSALTITSCEPIGIADHRIIVRAALVEIIPYSDDYTYPSVYETEIHTPAELELVD